MSSFEGNSTFAANAMRSTLVMLQGRRALSQTARSKTPPPQHKTWQPIHGIVFNPSLASGSTRLMGTTATVELERDLALHSHTEHNYVLAETAAVGREASLEQNSALGHAKEALLTVLAPLEEVKPEDPAQNKLPVFTGTYNMTEEAFRAAKKAEPGSTKSYWSHTMYERPLEAGKAKMVTVHYCRSKETTETVTQKYFLDKKVIGFDIEWKMDATKNSGPKKNVSLIQIASEERVALFHIALYPKDSIFDLVAPSLKKIMEDPEITKVGVSIKADCTRLRKYLQIHSQGLFELSHLYKLIKYSESKDFKQINKKLVSLATQTQEHLHLPMFKGEVRSSDWSQKLLLDQIVYAASDSYAGYKLYETMEIKRKALDPTPPRPYHADLNLPIRVAEGVDIPVDEAEDLDPDDDEPALPTKEKGATPSTRPKVTSQCLKKDSDPNTDSQPSQEVTTEPTPSKTQSKTILKTKTPPPAKPPLLLAAEDQTTTYRQNTSQSTSPPRATAANLRAYFLWHSNPNLTLPEIASLLRAPPLQVRTVAHYILETVKLEGLEYEHGRAREMLKIWKEGKGSVAMAKRYWRLERELGWVDASDEK